MVNCSVKLCKNYSNKKGVKKGTITYHMFPTSPAAREKWINAIGQDGWFPEKKDAVCSEHFTKDSFKICKTGQRRLLRNSTPSKCLLFKAYFNMGRHYATTKTSRKLKRHLRKISLRRYGRDGDKNDDNTSHITTTVSGGMNQYDISLNKSEDDDTEDQEQTVRPSAEQTKAGPSTSGETLRTKEFVEDKYDVLGKYVAEKVRQLGTEQRLFVERIIHETIFEGQMGKLNINSQLVVNTETFVPGPSSYAKKMESEATLNEKNVSGIKIEIDIDEPEDELSENDYENQEESHCSDESVSDTCTKAKRRRLKKPGPDETSELYLEDVPDIKVEIVTREDDDLGEGFESVYLKTDAQSTTNIDESNPQKKKISDEPGDAATHSQEKIDKIKLEMDMDEENWNLQGNSSDTK